MKIELKAVSHSPRQSRDSECYFANVYIDGVKEGTVENDGWGGPDIIHPYSLKQKLEAYAATLPPLVDSDDGYATPQNADILMATALTIYMKSKKLKASRKGRSRHD